jgi:hypothetical protein
MCALFKAYTGERAWKAMGYKLQTPSYLSKVENNRKIRTGKHTINAGKHSFVNSTITDWNHLTEGREGHSPVIRVASERLLGKR